MNRESIRKAARGLAIAGVVAAILYLFAPQMTVRHGSVKAPAARTPMPDFTMPNMAGKAWKLADHKGKVLFVNFWATWCGPCRAETPALVSVGNRHRASGFEVVGITMDDDPDGVVPDFAARFGMNYPILVPPSDSALAAAIQSYPTSFLLDKHGRVARTFVGAVDENDLDDDIRTLLAE